MSHCSYSDRCYKCDDQSSTSGEQHVWVRTTVLHYRAVCHINLNCSLCDLDIALGFIGGSVSNQSGPICSLFASRTQASDNITSNYTTIYNDEAQPSQTPCGRLTGPEHGDISASARGGEPRVERQLICKHFLSKRLCCAAQRLTEAGSAVIQM